MIGRRRKAKARAGALVTAVRAAQARAEATLAALADGHKTRVVLAGATSRFRFACDCGERGPKRLTPHEARGDAAQHVEDESAEYVTYAEAEGGQA
jgi:hypothetical protein